MLKNGQLLMINFSLLAKRDWLNVLTIMHCNLSYDICKVPYQIFQSKISDYISDGKDGFALSLIPIWISRDTF